MTPRIDTEPDHPLPPLPAADFKQLLTEPTRLPTVRTRVQIHAYDCDYIRGTRTGACTCGDAA